MPPGPTTSPPALSAEHIAQLAASSIALRKARRAAGAAKFSGWTLALFAAITALGGLTDPISLATALALAVIAWSEFKGARAVQRLDPTASRRLVANQLALLALIIVYGGLNIAHALAAGPPAGLEPTGEAQVDQMLGEIGDLTKLITLGVYAALVVIGVPIQLLMAAYHARRGRQLRDCLAQTPPWVIEVARAA